MKASIPEVAIKRTLDLGCGTGRFTQALSEAFACSAVGVEPSVAMLEVAAARGDADVEWKLGDAEDIPLADQFVDLVFMSQVFHHLSNPQRALAEIRRVLTPNGYLVLRNGTREHNHELEWLRFFPDARRIEDARTPSSSEIESAISDEHFLAITHQTIRQAFATSYPRYFEKIGRRGLSSLIAISEDAFQDGMANFKSWIDQQPADTIVYEPVDIFIFQKRTGIAL